MSPKVKPQSIKIITDINNLSFNKRHDVFILNSYKQKAEEFISNLPDHAYEILGVIATLEKNKNQLHYYHKLAVNHSSEKATSYFNYAVSLMKLGYLKQSIEKAEKSYKYDNLNLENIDILIKHNFCLGNFSNAIKYLNLWNKLSVKNKHYQTKLVEDASDILKESDFTQNVLLKFIDGILKIFQDDNIYIQNCGVNIVEKNNSKYLKFYYLIDVKYETLLEIEDKVYEYLLKAPQEIHNMIMINLDTEDPRLEEFIIYLNNYEKDNPNCFKKLDSDKMDFIAKLVQVDY